MSSIPPLGERRPTAHLSRCVALLALAAAAVGAALWIVLVARFGPVVWVLDRDHGVHTGDAAALPLLGLASAALWPLRRSRRTTGSAALHLTLGSETRS